MRKSVLTMILCLVSCIVSLAQNKTDNTKIILTHKDSLYLEYLDTYVSQLREPQYKLYPTTNNWTFLKLNTRTGQIWQVQYSVDDSPRMEYVLDDSPRVWDSDEQICGRFELYPTKNNFNFILLDNIDGRCWQVQWSIDKEHRMVKRIF